MLNLSNVLVNELRELAGLLTDTTEEGKEAILYGFGIKEKDADHIIANCVHSLAEELGAELQGVFYGGFLTSYWALYTLEGGYFFRSFDNLAVCEECGFMEELDFMYETEDDGWVCEDCCNNYYYYCDNCGRFATETYTVKTTSGDMQYCQSCIDSKDNIYQCEECGDYFTYSCGYVDNWGTAICDDCYGDDWVMCEECGRLINLDNAYYRGDYFYCEDCCPSIQYCRPYFEDVRSDKRAVSFGVEIESGTDELSPESEFCYFYPTEDCSIEGYRVPVEWVSDIFCLADILDSGKIARELTDIENNYSSNHSCGLHVHAGAEFFKPLSVEKARLFIHNNYTQLVKFCRRYMDDAYHWAEDGVSSSSNKGDTLAEKLKYYTGDRYEALNITNTDTVELRLFSGSTDKYYIQAAVCFYAALIEYCNTHNFLEVNKASILDMIEEFSNKKAVTLLKVYYYNIM